MDALPASQLSVIAAVYYSVVAVLCFAAYFRCRRQEDIRSAARLVCSAGWMLLCFAFVRVFGLEELVREFLRDLFETHGLIEKRRTFQFAILLLLGAGATIIAWPFAVRQNLASSNLRGMAVLAIKLALIGFLLLVSARLVSWHALDSVLYAEFFGIVRLNWILDLGLVAILGGSAILIERSSRNIR